MPMSIYPPILPSTQASFVPESTYRINYTLPSYMSIDLVQHVQILICKQSSNTSVATSAWPDGVIYYTRSNLDTQRNQIILNSSDIQGGWSGGTVYRIQVRFGLNSKYTSNSAFAAWKRTQIDSEAFSEWSNVMIVKPLSSKPQLTFLNGATSVDNVTSTSEVEVSTRPQFFVEYKGDEALDQYRFILYTEDGASQIEDSGWITYTGEQSKYLRAAVSGLMSDQQEYDETATYFNHTFSHILTNESSYRVECWMRTVNGYETTKNDTTLLNGEYYDFTVQETYLEDIEGLVIGAIDNTPYCRDNGCIQITLRATVQFNGNYVISRTSNASNYQEYEDIKYLLYREEYMTEDTIVFEDFTVESGVRYRYAVQYENILGLRTAPVVSATGNNYHQVDFEYSYFYRDGIQLRVMFNQNISSFKHDVLRTKQDTLGSKYPFLSQNGIAYYAEFPMTGTISFHMDEDQTFFKLGPGGYYWKDTLVIPANKFYEDAAMQGLDVNNNRSADTIIEATGKFNHFGGYFEKYSGDYASVKDEMASAALRTKDVTQGIVATHISDDRPTYTINTELTHDNIYIERIFREKVEEFLNEFTYKLYKSPTEGNMVVALMNVTLTPKQQLGRMIFDFSATAYEIAENTIPVLDESGIITIGSRGSLSKTDETIISFGQISMMKDLDTGYISSGIYGSNKDIMTQIRAIEEFSVGEGYKRSLYRITDLEIELYPEIDLQGEIVAYEAQGADNPAAVAAAAAYTEMKDLFAGQAPQVIAMSIDANNVMIMPNRKYHLSEPVTTSLDLIYCDRPIIVNYVCEMQIVEDTSADIVAGLDISSIWGQISGIFTDSDIVLTQYDYRYNADGKPYRVYNPNYTTDRVVQYVPSTTFKSDSENIAYILNDSTNYNVYRTTNIFDVIKEETQKQVEKNYKTVFGDDGFSPNRIKYSFGSLTQIDIEADAGTVIEFDGPAAAGPWQVVIGPSNRFILKPQEDQISSIRFVGFNGQAHGTYAIINYRCLTNQIRYSHLEG